MEGRNGLYKQNSGLWRSFRDGDFEEEDVWAVLKERTDSKHSSVSSSSSSSTSISKKTSSSAARMIPRSGSDNYQSSSTYKSNNVPRLIQQSAPVNIPRWSNIYDHKKSKTSSSMHHELDDDDDESDDGEEEEEDDDDDEYRNKVPPHEVIARRLARSHISSFSVFEGVGRTLKGRDLSKVRNSVLTKTGFLESP